MTSLRKVRMTVRALAVAGAMIFLVTAAWGKIGDCAHDGAVTIDDLVIGVNIALGTASLSDCESFDANGDGRVTVDELVAGVDAALVGVEVTPQAFVTATDYQTGAFATIGLDAPRTVRPTSPSSQLSSDPVARRSNGMVYVVNRFGTDTIRLLDPAQDYVTRFECSTGSGSNPNDIALASATKAYVPLFARKNLLVVNPSARADCTDFVIDSVDLSPLADADGIPDMNQAAVVGDYVYVSLQRLGNFMPTGPGALAIVDTRTEELAGSIELTAANPFAETKGLTVDGSSLLVSEVGYFGVNDGGIERVDLASRTAQGFIITEAAIGGDITDFVVVSEHRGYALVSDQNFMVSLVAFDPAAGTRTSTVTVPGSLSDIELNSRGELFAADRSIVRPGVRIFQVSDGSELTSQPISVGLPPATIVFVE